jgi:hypothetical protein
MAGMSHGDGAAAPREITCSQCSGTFPYDPRRANRKRCDACLAPRPCARCGTAFVPPQQNPKARFCSHPCAIEADRAARATATAALVVGLRVLPPPPTRGDCQDGPRPCPYLTCRHHLGDGAKESCALDVADRGETERRDVAALLGVSQQRVAQIERQAMARLLKVHGEALLREVFGGQTVAGGWSLPDTDGDET